MRAAHSLKMRLALLALLVILSGGAVWADDEPEDVYGYDYEGGDDDGDDYDDD